MTQLVNIEKQYIKKTPHMRSFTQKLEKGLEPSTY